MTVGELREVLGGLPSEMPVMVLADEFGTYWPAKPEVRRIARLRGGASMLGHERYRDDTSWRDAPSEEEVASRAGDAIPFVVVEEKDCLAI